MRCLMCKSFIRDERKTRCKRCSAMNVRNKKTMDIPKTATTLVATAPWWSRRDNQTSTSSGVTSAGEFHYAYRF